MPKIKEINKVLVIGSGPIVIGQAAEFDYAGTQACMTLKEEGCDVVLINNNPATIMTDEQVADTVYFEPLTVEQIEKIIKIERPDGILVSVSGQTGLNLAFKLEETGLIEKYNLHVLGTSVDAIKQGEDRHLFRTMMNEINEPISESTIVENVDDALSFSDEVGYPIIVRPAYTLGGSGGGIATGENSFIEFVTRGLRASPINQCLIERSIAGWKEIEFEVIRDKDDTAVVVCHMENIDPVGVHTGDSIVVAPIQTLTEAEITTLREASLKIVKQIGIVGACNVQLAYEPNTKQYIVIEVNPRVSRSSALASKATGYPIAKIATKLSLGYTLQDIPFGNTTLAEYEPELDYVVVKFPCWPFDKLTTADRRLGTQMKATGEVMAIEHNLTSGLQKAIRSLEIDVDGVTLTDLQTQSTAELQKLVLNVDDRRFFVILELLRRGVALEQIEKTTKIDRYFLNEMATLVQLEQEAKQAQLNSVTVDQLIAFKQAGFMNRWLAKVWNSTEQDVKAKLTAAGIHLTYEKINAFTEDIEEEASYYYSVWQMNAAEKQSSTKREKVLIIGSGPIRIGQGVEFDYCSVQGIKALENAGYETVLINNNPATVSTDYEVADTLYFEPITIEDVLHVMEYEQIEKVIVQFGGQTAINLVKDLEAAGITLLGTNQDTIDMLEDRERFYQYVQQIGVPHIPGLTAMSAEDLRQKAQQIGYPVLIRPSYVIGGKGMKVIENEKALEQLLTRNVTESAFPILIDAFYPGKEIEVDVVTDGTNILIPTIFEHIEKAGVHSGDSMAITPPVNLTSEQKKQVVDYAEKVAQGMNFKGIFNIQFVMYEEVLYVLEVNPRASRTVPVTSKITSVDMIELATNTLLGSTLSNNVKLLPENDFYTTKASVFSSTKLPGVDPILVPEMKSTGELIAVSDTVSGSMTKAFIWNESLHEAWQQEEKEILIAIEDEYAVAKLTEKFAQIGIAVKTFSDETPFQTIEEWMKTDAAFAVVSTETSNAIRERAQEFNLIVMSTVETAFACASMMTEELDVHVVKESLNLLQKEVILQ